MNVVELITRKRDGGVLSAVEIRELVEAYTTDRVPDYQMSAFLMAAMLMGMSPDESAALTEAMLRSGSVLDLTSVTGIKVDKHSTGGVGDKISLLLAPMVAAAGVPVPMISGRGLGHTGGTLDKLEAIPGFRTDLSIREYREQLADIGLVMIGQTAEIAPADRKLYALRDVTGTVEFIPYIASSIMSKKLAEGIDALVLDVKWGRGAFMRAEEDARRLAETLVGIGNRHDRPTVAWLTDMNDPLGFAIGNWPETHEAIRCLHGERVPAVSTLAEVLAGEMICLGGIAESPERGREVARETITSGAALRKFIEMVERQGGRSDVVMNPADHDGTVSAYDVVAPDSMDGTIASIDSYAVGRAAVRLGAGRETVDDEVDPMAGLELLKKSGDRVQPGERLARLYTNKSERVKEIVAAVAQAFEAGAQQKRPLLADRYADGRWSGASIPDGA